MGKKFIILVIAIFAIVAAAWSLVISCKDPLLWSVQEVCFNEKTQSYGIFIEPEMERVEKLETTDFFEDEKSGVGKIEFFHEIQHSADLSVGDVVSFYWAPPYSLLWIGDFSIKTFKLFIFVDCFLEIFSALMSLLVIIFLVFILYVIFPRISRKYVNCRVRQVKSQFYEDKKNGSYRIFYVEGLDAGSSGFTDAENIDAFMFNRRKVETVVDLETHEKFLPEEGEIITAVKDECGKWNFYAGEISVRKLIKKIKKKYFLDILVCFLLIVVCAFIILA